jgi:Cu2+-exporting ATPase
MNGRLPALLRELGARAPAQLDGPTAAWRERDAAVLHVVRDGQVVGAIALEDEVRPESREAVDELHRHGHTVAMVGDGVLGGRL